MARAPKKLDEGMRAAAERLGLFRNDENVTQLRPPAPHVPIMPKRVRGSRREETDEQYVNRQVKNWGLSSLKKAEGIPPYDVTDPARYPAVQLSSEVSKKMLATMLRLHENVMKPEGITPGELKAWREQYMLMTRADLATLLRVHQRTIWSWESGATSIPFSMWWVIHATMRDPECFLTRPGFHDFYIDYWEGKAYFCSRSWPDIRWTATDMYFNRCALNEVLRLRTQLQGTKEKVDELTAENTRLRQLLKTEGVTAELQALHAQIGELARRVQTADVMPFDTASMAAVTHSTSTKTA